MGENVLFSQVPVGPKYWIQCISLPSNHKQWRSLADALYAHMAACSSFPLSPDPQGCAGWCLRFTSLLNIRWLPSTDNAVEESRDPELEECSLIKVWLFTYHPSIIYVISPFILWGGRWAGNSTSWQSVLQWALVYLMQQNKILKLYLLYIW